MADQHQEFTYCNTIWEHCERVKPEEKKKYKGNTRCKQCKESSSDMQYLEAHLYHAHKIHTTEGNFIWGDSIVERYFRREHKYIAKCNECGLVLHVYEKSKLLDHLELHPDILNTIQNEITSSWLNDHFRIDTESGEAHCIHKCFSFKIVNGIDFFKKHLAVSHWIKEHSESGRGTRSYNVEATIQQPVAEGSYASTSTHHRHRQGDQQSFLIGPYSAPSTSTSMSHDNLHRVIQHRSGTETIKQMIPPEQERGAASGFDIEECAEFFETLQSESETADLLDQTKLFESKDASSQIKPVPCSAKSVDDENVKNLPESKTRKRKSDPTDEDVKSKTRKRESDPTDEDVKNLPESKTRKRKSDPTKQSPEEGLLIDLEYEFKATDVRQSSSEDSE
ncbi:uncharacterized protein [Temnothorax nylanderi]|uniref:uncharacterized protein n=1 Tax=Temnothorax nylanderi TaxID=102681 RepID=UPI003A8753EA